MPKQDIKEDELWQIIENQSSIIAELRKALNDMTLERDNLLKKLNTAATIPTPPPRSPFRFNKKPTNVDIKQDDENNRITIKVKSVKRSTCVLSIIHHTLGQELWSIEKFYSDFPIPLNDKLVLTQQIEDCLLSSKMEDDWLYSFITPKKKKEGYLYKREKDGWKKYYFILTENELLYYYVSHFIHNKVMSLNWIMNRDMKGNVCCSRFLWCLKLKLVDKQPIKMTLLFDLHLLF